MSSRTTSRDAASGFGGGAAAAMLVIATVLFGVCAGVSAAYVQPGFSWRHSMISDLGSRLCIQRVGFRSCSRAWIAFNLGSAASGLLILLAAWILRRRLGWLVSVSVAVLGLGLVIVGTIPSDVEPDLHLAGAVAALPVAAAGLLISGVGRRPLGPRPRARTRAFLGALALFFCLDHVGGDGGAPLPRGLAELVSVAGLMAFLLLEAWCALPQGSRFRPRGRD